MHFLLASGSGCNSSLPVVCLLVHGVGSSYTPSRSVPSAWGFRLAVLGLGVMDLPESMCIYVPGRLLGPVTSVLWRTAVGGRETSSSWPCGWGFAGVTRTWLTSWTLAEPLQPEFRFFGHTEGPAPSDGSRRQPRVQLWGHPGERAWRVSLHFWLAWACGAQPMFQPPYPSPHPSPPVLRVPGEVTPTILSPLSASWVYQCQPQDSTRPQRDGASHRLESGHG